MKIKKKYKYLICDSIKAYNHFKEKINYDHLLRCILRYLCIKILNLKVYTKIGQQ